MLGKKKQYVITITQTSDEVNELVGKLALELNQMQQLGVSILSGFVVTSTAFDDFLVANDLVSFIAPRINDLNYNDEFTVKKASEEIRQIIASSVVPDMVKNPILKAYAGLSGFIESFVSVQASPIDSKLDEKKYHKPLMLTNIKGADLLMDSLKQSWAEFFSEAALAYRAGIGYEGYLTEALIIQKMPHAELSGKILTVNSHDHDPEVLEVQAIWGLDENLVGKEITPDSYFYDKKSEAVKEKKIVGQDWMLVRRGRGDSSKPTVRVNISKSLQKKQKLDDKNILGLARVGAVIENYYQKPQEISWIYEAGKTYITQSRDLDLTKESGPVISKDFSAKLQELDTEMALKKGKQGKTMESYVAEVQSSQEKSSEVEVVVEPISKLSGLNFGKGKGKDPAFGLVHHVLQAQDYDNLTGDEILVVPELLPDYLDKINTVKGLVVEKDVAEDLLEKVQVPLVYNLNKSTENMQENMVVTLDPESAQVLAGAGKKAAPDTEKVPETAKPGKEPESNIVFDIVGEAIPVVRSKIASKAEKGNAKPAGGQTKEMAGKPAAESAVSLGPAVPGAGAALTDLPDVQPAKEVKNEKEHKEPESKEKPETPVEPEAAAEKEIPETKKQNNGEVLQKTVTEFWQFLEVVGPEINPPNIDGVFVQIQSFYDVLKVNPDDLIKRKEQRQDFISKVLEQLKEILAKLQGKPLVLQGITKNPAAGNGDNDEFMEKVNVDLAIIDRIRNRESYRNVWYALGGVNNAREQSELKKIITSYGLRRSSTFKIYTTLATPIAAISVKSLLENEIDAVILDLDKLLEAFAIGSLDEGFSDFLTWLIRTVNTNKNNALLLIKEVTVSKDQVAALLNAGLHGFIMHYDDFKHMKQVVSSLEVKRVVKEKSKRGRRPKKLDYGF